MSTPLISPPIWWKGISRLTNTTLFIPKPLDKFLHLFGGKVFRDYLRTTRPFKNLFLAISPPIWWKGISRHLYYTVV